jgi:hypothetical protein
MVASFANREATGAGYVPVPTSPQESRNPLRMGCFSYMQGREEIEKCCGTLPQQRIFFAPETSIGS